MLAVVDHQSLPSTVRQAKKDLNWRNAMKAEYEALIRNKTWELVPKTSHQNVVGCKWIFRIKYKVNGELDKYKARLVAKGFTQRPGIDFNSTFSPVVKPATVRLVLSIACQRQWGLHQLDVNNAFLQGQLEDEVYMQQPQGFESTTYPNYVCKLRKAIYGLKQAPRAWFLSLSSFLLSYGFLGSKSDSSLFIYSKAGVLMYLLVYVDDIIVTGNNSMAVKRMIEALAVRFSIKDMGRLHFFLGVEVVHKPDGLVLTQSKYISEILKKYNMHESKGVLSPMSSSLMLQVSDGSAPADTKQYREILGKLQYLSFTRPDISFTVNKLSQYMHSPTAMHWQAVKRLLRYLKHTINYGIFLSRTSSLSLQVFADADWAGNQHDRTSTSGYIAYLGASPISWSSKKQKTVARSSTEAEYRSVAGAVAEVNWLQNLIKELHISLPTVPTVFCDNVGVTYLCKNPVFHSRMKHIAVDFHFVRNQVQSGSIRVTHLHSADQLADMMTKAQIKILFQQHLSKLGIVELTPNLRGHKDDKVDPESIGKR